MSMWPADIEQAASRLISDFAARGLLVATAESCTGGLIVGTLTEIAGSSAVVDRGFVTYSNEAKTALLGVRPETLSAHGAVSEETALEMVQGALAASRADCVVAVTGIAGPAGGSPETGETSVAPPAANKPAPPAAASGGYVEATFDDVKFAMEKTEKFERSMLTDKVRSLLGKPIRIRGYMYPTLRKRGLTQFVLVRDNMECCFGPGAALYDCILVTMAPGE